MQLLIIALMLMLSGKNTNVNQIKPIIEKFGGEQAAYAFRQAEDAIKQAEEISEVISAVASMSNASAACGSGGSDVHCADQTDADNYPLAPISAIADDDIMSFLSRYIALGE